MISIAVYQIRIHRSNMDKLNRSLTVNQSRFDLPRTSSCPEWRLSRKGEFIGINWRLRAFAHIKLLGSKCQWQGSSTQTTRHIELTIMRAGKKNLQSKKAAEDLREIGSYFKAFWRSHYQQGMNGSSASVRNYPRCETTLQNSRHKGFSKHWRVVQGIL